MLAKLRSVTEDRSKGKDEGFEDLTAVVFAKLTKLKPGSMLLKAKRVRPVTAKRPQDPLKIATDVARDAVMLAAKRRMIFTVFGAPEYCLTLRESLLKRGWIERPPPREPSDVVPVKVPLLNSLLPSSAYKCVC